MECYRFFMCQAIRTNTLFLLMTSPQSADDEKQDGSGPVDLLRQTQRDQHHHERPTNVHYASINHSLLCDRHDPRGSGCSCSFSYHLADLLSSDGQECMIYLVDL